MPGYAQVRHGIEHGSRRAVYNYAVFGGSNGFWRTDTLQVCHLPAPLSSG